MDSAELRRGKPCWHLKVGMTAINDSFLLCTLMYELLRMEFDKSTFYKISSVINEV